MYQVGHLGHKATPRSPREGERRRGGRGLRFGKELFPVLVHQAEFIVQHRLVARHELLMPRGGGGGGGVQVLGFRQAIHSSQGSYYMWSIMYMCLHTYRHVETTGKGLRVIGHSCATISLHHQGNIPEEGKIGEDTVKVLISNFHGEWLRGEIC